MEENIRVPKLVDDDHIPPMVQHLKSHYLATKVGFLDDDAHKRDDLDLCDCCAQVIEKQ